MTVTARPRRPPMAARRAGYVAAAMINAALIYLIAGWPGWQAVPFLTTDTRQVLGLVFAALIASAIANLGYLCYDPPWVRALGDLVTTGIGLAAAIRVWQVYPFDIDGWAGWSVLVRALLVIAIAGSAIGLVVQAGTLLRAARGRWGGGG